MFSHRKIRCKVVVSHGNIRRIVWVRVSLAFEQYGNFVYNQFGRFFSAGNHRFGFGCRRTEPEPKVGRLIANVHPTPAYKLSLAFVRLFFGCTTEGQ